VLRKLANHCIIALMGVIGCTGCTTEERRLQQHQEKLESFEATTSAVAEAWLAGVVSATYTRTALEQTFVLVEQQRTALVSQPQALLNPKSARLWQAAEGLSRRLALLSHDVDRRDAVTARQHLSALPTAPSAR
jgi:hypothetical protein